MLKDFNKFNKCIGRCGRVVRVLDCRSGSIAVPKHRQFHSTFVACAFRKRYRKPFGAVLMTMAFKTHTHSHGNSFLSLH